MDSFNLKRRVFIVTGGGGFLGAELCSRILANNGVPVAVDLCPLKLDHLRTSVFEKFGVELDAFTCDITEEDQVEELFLKLTAKFQIINGLVNNAARNPKMESQSMSPVSDRLEYETLSRWKKDQAVSLDGAFLLSKYFVRHAKSRLSNDEARYVVLNVSSDLGIISPNHGIYSSDSCSQGEFDRPVKPINYSVSKAGIIGLSRYLATYLPSRLRSNALCPGGIYNGQPKDFVERLSTLIPMSRMASLQEVSGPAIFLLSDISSYINGCVLTVDGGRSAW